MRPWLSVVGDARGQVALDERLFGRDTPTMNIGSQRDAIFIVPAEESVEVTMAPVPIAAELETEETLTAVN